MNDRLARVLEHPLHQHLGVRAIDSAEGRGRLSIEVTDTVLNPAGALHGGVIYTLCDVCAYAGLLSVLDADTHAVTSDIHISVMRAARKGETVDFRSEVVRLGRRLCFLNVEVLVGGHPIASARVTKSIVSAGS